MSSIDNEWEEFRRFAGVCFFAGIVLAALGIWIAKDHWFGWVLIALGLIGIFIGMMAEIVSTR